MPEATVLVFFYGSCMNRALLAEVGLAPASWEAASLPSYDIRIAPRQPPEAVLARAEGGAWRPALCYIAPLRIERPADSAYIERILQPARELGFPSWYLARPESFRP